MKIIFNIFFYIFVVFAGGLGLLLVATLIPFPGNYEAKIVQSGSMEPAIGVGSLIVTQPSSVYEIGDVVTFGEDTKTQIPTTHRIIEIQEKNGQRVFIVKGDANDTADPNPVAESAVIGKVVFSIPKLGFLLDFARTPLGFILLVGIPLAAVVIEEVSNIFSEVRRIAKKKPHETGEAPSHGAGTLAREDTDKSFDDINTNS